jgi:hypothetical protein
MGLKLHIFQPILKSYISDLSDRCAFDKPFILVSIRSKTTALHRYAFTHSNEDFAMKL